MANPTSKRFGENVRAVRGRMGQRELAERVTELGVPMRFNTVSRIEQGHRVADVVELLALSVALGVSPSRLLLSEAADGDEVELTPTTATTARDAWWWAAGERPLPEQSADPDEGGRAFREQNRPHDPPTRYYLDDLPRYASGLAAVRRAIAEAEVPEAAVLAYLRLREGGVLVDDPDADQ